jgi:hypothetical protein
MPHLPRILLSVLVACFLMTAGCTSPFDNAGSSVNMTTDGKQVVSSYQITLAQPETRSDFIRMDSDVYNTGEVVEFLVTNDGLIPLECTNTPPEFRVTYQTGSGRWATKMGPEIPVTGNISFLQKGQSTKMYRFISTGWEPGRYRILSDCGVGRDFLIRALSTPVPTVTTCPAANLTNTTPWIRVDPVTDQYAARPFTITGTTNLPAGQELKYSIFSLEPGEQNTSITREGTFSTLVEEGSCGINRWSAMGEIQATGDFFIGISDPGQRASAIKRFSVYEP